MDRAFTLIVALVMTAPTFASVGCGAYVGKTFFADEGKPPVMFEEKRADGFYLNQHVGSGEKFQIIALAPSDNGNDDLNVLTQAGRELHIRCQPFVARELCAISLAAVCLIAWSNARSANSLPVPTKAWEVHLQAIDTTRLIGERHETPQASQPRGSQSCFSRQRVFGCTGIDGQRAQKWRPEYRLPTRGERHQSCIALGVTLSVTPITGFIRIQRAENGSIFNF